MPAGNRDIRASFSLNNRANRGKVAAIRYRERTCRSISRIGMADDRSRGLTCLVPVSRRGSRRATIRFTTEETV